jgi:hypothetical protein
MKGGFMSRLVRAAGAVLIGMVILAGAAGFAGPRPDTILLPQFAVYSDSEISYMKDAIRDMLSTRLESGEAVQVVSTGEGPVAGEEDAKALLQRYDADFLVKGSLTYVNRVASLDLVVYHGMDPGRRRHFYHQGEGLDSVIAGLNQIAPEILESLRDEPGKEVPDQEALGKAEEEAVEETGQTGASQPSRKPRAELDAKPEEPDRLPEEEAAPDGEGMGVKRSRSIACRSESGVRAQWAFWKTKLSEGLFQSVSVGQTDADPDTEVVLLAQKEIRILRPGKERFRMAAAIELKSNQNAVSLDLADINGNGRDEIFVSAFFEQGSMPNSTVYEYQNGSYRVIAEKSEWLYRVDRNGRAAPVLYGQSNQFGDPYSGAVYRLEWEKGAGYRPAEKLTQNRDARVNVLGMVFGRLGDSLPEARLIAYNPSDRIQILDGDEPVRVDRTAYGGSLSYAPVPDPEQNEDCFGAKKVFLPLRLLLYDLDDDGNNELLAPANHSKTNDFVEFRAFGRRFEGARLVVLTYDGTSLVEICGTGRFEDLVITDAAIGDVDNDGENELVASMVLNDFSFLKKNQSLLYVLEDI